MITNLRKEIREIPLGESRVFKCRDRKQVHSVQTTAYMLNNLDDANYSTKTNFKTLEIEIWNRKTK